MSRRPMTRLAVAAAAAGTICALGASAAFAAPALSWHGGGVVPGAITNDSPGLSSISFPVPSGTGQLVGWRARGNDSQIFYKYKVPGLHKGKWSATAKVPGTTSSAPAFGSYIDPLGRTAVLAVWTGPADHHIWYNQGETKANGTISWQKHSTALPKTVANTNTSAGPAVLFTDHAYRVIIAWRGPGLHVRFVVGIPVLRGFKWGASRVVTGPTVTPGCKDTVPCTGNTPALAEVNSNVTTGSIYFFWRQLDTQAIVYSTTPDTALNLNAPAFTANVTVPGAASLLGPAASDLGINGLKPLMLAYKSALSTAIRYQILTPGPTPAWTVPFPVPAAHTVAAPALLFNELGSTTPGNVGNIALRFFR
jgi:hypothetical protein